MSGKIVKRYSLSRQVADELEKLIESGKYKVGEKIPTEVELIKHFNVSRNTIREAVHSLTSAGILDVRQGDGTYVKSLNRFNGYMNLKYGDVSLRDIREARNVLEIAIAPLAALRRTEKDMAKITEAFNARKNLSDSIRENTIADVNFHIAIAEAAHNKIMLDLYKSIASFIEGHIKKVNETDKANMKLIDDLHEGLFTAIKNHDAKEAGNCAENILKF